MHQFLSHPSSPLQKQGGKAAQEAAIEAELTEHGIDVIVLARYMQVHNAMTAAGGPTSLAVFRGLSLKTSAHGVGM